MTERINHLVLGCALLAVHGIEHVIELVALTADRVPLRLGLGDQVSQPDVGCNARAQLPCDRDALGNANSCLSAKLGNTTASNQRATETNKVANTLGSLRAVVVLKKADTPSRPRVVGVIE